MHDYQNARGGATGTELLAHYIQRFRGSLTPFTPESHAAKDLHRPLQDALWIAQLGGLFLFSCAPLLGLFDKGLNS